MIDREYEAINTRITNTFPALGEWFRNRLPSEDARQMQRERRKACLIGLEARDVEAAIAAIASGTECPWAGYGQEEWAYAKIAERAREFAAKRGEERHVESYRRKAPRQHGEASLMDLVVKLANAKRDGHCQPGEEAALLEVWLPPSDDKRDWVKCQLCGDRGLVTCVSTLKRRADGTPYHSSCLARCTECAAGEEIARRKSPPPDYDQYEHAMIRPTASGHEAEQAVRALLERREQSKRVGDFDRFNDREPAFT